MGTTQALNNLALGATADRDIMAQLTKVNAELIRTNKLLTNPLLIAMENIEALMAGGVEKGGDSLRKRKEWTDDDLDLNGNCWSCSWKVNFRNTSKTCWRKQKGHKIEATRADTRGGNEVNKG